MITGTLSSLEHAKNEDFNSCVSLGRLSNLSAMEHINFSAFSSVMSHGAGNLLHTISLTQIFSLQICMQVSYIKLTY